MIVLWSMILIKKVHLNQNKLEKILWGISHEIGGNQLIFKNQTLTKISYAVKNKFDPSRIEDTGHCGHETQTIKWIVT